MKIANRQYTWDGGAVLSDLECAACGGPLFWDYEDDFGNVPTWTATCCDIPYLAEVKSVRVSFTRE